jgi:phosphohistidine phosphatase
MRSAAAGMRALGLNFDLVLSSPLVRCRQTARIAIVKLRPRPTLRYLSCLAPGSSPAELIRHLAQLPPPSTVLLVGHEPGLSSFAGLLIAGPGSSRSFEFKKGGLCRIDFPAAPQPGTGHLIFHLTPRILRLLGEHEA